MPVMPNNSSGFFDAQAPAEVRIGIALARLAGVAGRIEGRWGFGKLERLVGADLARRFGLAREDLDSAIGSGRADAVEHFAAAMERGWQALETEAAKLGHQPGDLERVWYASAEGNTYALVQDSTDAAAVAIVNPGAIPVTVEEIARLLVSKELATVMAVKRAFPDAEIGAPRERVDWVVGDSLEGVGGVVGAAQAVPPATVANSGDQSDALGRQAASQPHGWRPAGAAKPKRRPARR